MSRAWLALTVLLMACGGDEVPTASEPGDCSQLDIDTCAQQLVAAMTLDEKIEQMHGIGLGAIEQLFHTATNERLSIPGFRMVDGPRGVRAGNATAFPVGMARGATWDPALERLVGDAIAKEAVAKGANVLLAPTMNLLRHPGWGRAQETYGEDTHHMTVMSAAFIEGAQQHLIATAKHYALNSIEDTRFEVDVSTDERTLREIYLRHFRHAVMQTGVGAVMSAYNSVNGFYCAENEHLVRDILKDEWGFDGFVMSDWFLGVHSTTESALAGLDVEMPAPVFYGPKLRDAVDGGDVPISIIDDAVTRIVTTKLRFDIAQPAAFGDEVVESDEHIELAREVARRSITLLKNDAALPLGSGDSIALVGSLAATANLGDDGSSAVHPSSSISPLAGLEALANEVTLIDNDAPTTSDEASIAAADAAVVVVGLTGEDEGENLGTSGGDRDSLSLSAAHVALIQQVAAISPRTIVVVEAGSAILVEDWLDSIQGLLMAYYPGQAGGDALAEILLGVTNPSGKLPFSVPVSEDQLVPFIHDEPAVSYDYLHGYRHLASTGEAPRFFFGFGLSYTTFDFGELTASMSEQGLSASIDVTNTGSVAGEEVVQLYLSYPSSNVERPPHELKAFARVALEPGETKTVTLDVAAESLAYYDADARAWTNEETSHRLLVGNSSGELLTSIDL